MGFLEFLADIVIYGSSDFVGNKKISHKTRKRILIVFIIVSLCYLGFSVFGIFWAIKTKSIILLALIILVLILFLYNLYKTIENYNDAQLMNKEIIKDFFDNLAPNWDNEPIADTTIINTILDNAKVCENIDVLDVACGTGVLFPYYLERNVKSITAVDLSPEMVKIAKSKFPQADIICGDAETISFDNQFDVIIIYNAFPHFPNPNALIENLSKALKTNGRISIAHGMSKKELDEIHMKSAGKVSNILPECEELKKMFESYFNVDIMISNEKMYQVSGTKNKELLMNNYFPEVKKNFGFGCMRLPRKGPLIDYEQTKQMVDTFLEAGFNYFDTAHGYMEMRNEATLKKCLTSRHPRESYILADKLSEGFFKKESQIRPLFEKQLKNCGVEYFDFYLMHAQNATNFEKYKECRAYETAFDLKKEGKIRHVGLSFHDKADVLDQILTEYPEVEFVQIQFNYLDYNDESVEGRKCYEVCRKHDKPVIVMEPVKGGSLVKLPDDAKKVLNDLNGGSPASYAIRFAASFDGIFMVLSGMSDMAQMNDNISFMKDFVPFNEKEYEAVNKVCQIMNAQHLIPCTACRYCVDGCPKNIPIPELFACMNDRKQFKDWNAKYYYEEVHTSGKGKASDCIECGLCENACPQHLEIRKLLKSVAKEFGK